MGKKIVGIDIGASSIKLVQLELTSGGFNFVTAGKIPTPSNALFSESEIDQKALSSAISSLVSESKANANTASVSLLESQVATKVIEMPILTDNEVASAIKWEAEQYIPWPIADVSMDWQIIKKSEKDDQKQDGKMQVLLVVAPTTLVNKYVKILKAANLEVVSVENEVIPLSRSVSFSDVNAPATMILDLGSVGTNICILEKGLLIFARAVATGGVALTRSVQNDLNLEFAQAEEYKRTYGLDKEKLEGKVFLSLKPIFDIIVNEIKRAFSFYQSLRPNDSLKRIVVSGGGAQLPGLVFYIASQLSDVEIQIADPWKNIKFPSKIIYDPRNEACDFATAVGLAMKEV